MNAALPKVRRSRIKYKRGGQFVIARGEFSGRLKRMAWTIHKMIRKRVQRGMKGPLGKVYKKMPTPTQRRMTATRRIIWRGEASNVASNAASPVFKVPNEPRVISRSETKRPARSSDLPHKPHHIIEPVIINTNETIISRMSM